MSATNDTTQPAPSAGSAVTVGDRVSVPRVSNPRRIWWATVVAVSPCGRFLKVTGRALGRPRWVGVAEIRETIKRRTNAPNTERSGGGQ